MPRGRRSQPDEVKALKGNPGKRRLLLESTAKPPGNGPSTPPPISVPDFLTEPRAVDIFRRVVGDYLQRRIARNADLASYARWAHYLHQWIECKETIGKNGGKTYYLIESNHGKRLARLPSFKDMLDLERALQSLEDRLGLNPVARQNIIKGLAAMPAALGGLFGEDPKENPNEKPSMDDAPTADEVVAQASPLGFLQSAAKH